MADERRKRLLLCRHAETGPDWKGRFVGVSDVPIAGRGPEQALTLAMAVSRFRPARLVISPRLRARQTAALVAEQTGLVASEDSALAEIDFGRWEGLDFTEILAKDPFLVEQWAICGDEFVFPGGEPVAVFRARVRSVCDRLIADDSEVIAVVSHGGVVRTMLCHLLGLPLDRHLSFEVHPARMAVVDVFCGISSADGRESEKLPHGNQLTRGERFASWCGVLVGFNLPEPVFNDGEM